MLFYGVEIVLGGFYFHSSRPNVFFHWSLSIAMLIDTVCTVVICYNAYFWIVLEPEVLSHSFSNEQWMLPTTILCTYNAAMVEQIFFIRRFWQMTNNKLATFLACSLLTAHMALHWKIGIEVYVYQMVTPFNIKLALIAATLCAATDLFIAMAMLHTTITTKTAYTSTQRCLSLFQSPDLIEHPA
ncbi:hypothetical protein BDP27DRAFT_259854 [Rhodocollybia butyracea]|uniref:Uncharacterized protein n=1 Tax=Rhodocollybia butyracea TaxID=206335 RepID=A0A9P5PHS8_9AGAR|nr:hypothetical protein BDP27DRAFT_259854 [Rhodocollybia butyracea]